MRYFIRDTSIADSHAAVQRDAGRRLSGSTPSGGRSVTNDGLRIVTAFRHLSTIFRHRPPAPRVPQCLAPSPWACNPLIGKHRSIYPGAMPALVRTLLKQAADTNPPDVWVHRWSARLPVNVAVWSTYRSRPRHRVITLRQSERIHSCIADTAIVSLRSLVAQFFSAVSWWSASVPSRRRPSGDLARPATWWRT